MKRPTLLQEVEQYIYSYAQNLPSRKLLLAIVHKWEEAYQARIEELEKADNSGNRMENEGAPIRQRDGSELSSADMRDLRGNRYEDID